MRTLTSLWPYLSKGAQDLALRAILEAEELGGPKVSSSEIEAVLYQSSFTEDTSLDLTIKKEVSYSDLLSDDNVRVEGSKFCVTNRIFLTETPLRVELNLTLEAEIPKEDIDFLASLGKVHYSIVC